MPIPTASPADCLAALAQYHRCGVGLPAPAATLSWEHLARDALRLGLVGRYIQPCVTTLPAAELPALATFALAGPLLFQAVMDKVLVYRTLHALDVLVLTLFANPRVLILDEATSALDVTAEALVLANMPQIAHGRTVLMIAHREQVMRVVSRVVRL